MADSTYTPTNNKDGDYTIKLVELSTGLYALAVSAVGAAGAATTYAEDTAHVSGDILTMAGVVRTDSLAALGANGDRTLLQVNSQGALYTTLSQLIAGEDLTVGVMKTEQRFTGLRVTADTQVKGAPGFVHTLTFACSDAAPTAGSIIVYDSLTETGTILYSETFDTTAFRGFTVILDCEFTVGLYVGFTTTADVGCTVSYR